MRLAFVVDGYGQHAGVILHQHGNGAVTGEARTDADVDVVADQVARILSLDHDGAPFVEAGEYRKVEPGRLLEFDMSLARGGTVFSRTRCTVEFLDRGVGTQLVLTDEGDGAGEHATGWGPALDHLAQLLG